VPTHKGTKLR